MNTVGGDRPILGIAGALEVALGESWGIEGRDAAAVALARQYATLLDDDPSISGDLGPKLLAVLTALGMTPAARSAVAKGVVPDGNPAADALARLRERRRGEAR